MSPRIFLTSDGHLGHRALPGGRDGLSRPFASIEEHDEALIANRNAVVRPGDKVWHLGDIHLHGHSHGTLPGTAASTDVGVDCLGFRPVTLDEIRIQLAENAAADWSAP